MKKQKIASCLKLGIFLFGISVLLWNCEKEVFDQPPITKSSANLQKLNYSLKTLSYTQLIKDTEIQPSLKFLQGVFASKKTKGTFGKIDTQLADGLIISTEQINRIVALDVITWAFKVETPLLESSDFENFLVKKHNDTFRYFLVSYIKDTENDENLYKKATLYKLSKEVLNLNELHLSGMQGDELFEDYEDGVGGGSSGCEGEIYQEVEPCVSSGGYHILKYACQHSGSPPPHGLGDIPPCDFVCSGTTIITIIDFSDCESGTYDPPNGPTNDVSDDTQTDGGAGGDAGNSDTDGTTTITAPVEIEDPNCPPGSGKIMIDEVCMCPPNSGKVENSKGKCVCPNGYIEDFNMNCVLNPCRKIRLEIQNPVFYNKIDSLKLETGKKKETGYMQYKDGSYTQLTETNNGHSLKIPIYRNVSVGFMHTHLDDFLTGKMIDGVPELAMPIKMFSPNDIFNFLRLVKNTKFNGVPLSSVYATMVSSKGIYTLRFTGNPNDVSNTLSLSTTEYEKYIKENGNEKGVLKYLKDKVNINGLHLFKLENNNTVKEKTLSNDGDSVDSNNCN